MTEQDMLQDLSLAPEELRDNYEFVQKALKIDESNFEYASERLKSSQKFALDFIQNNSWEDSVRQLSGRELEERFGGDSDHPEYTKTEVIQRQSISGDFLEHASDEVRCDLQVLIEMVKHSNYQIKFAGDEAKNDPELMLAILEHTNGYECRFWHDISDKLKDDIDFIYQATKVNESVFECLPEELQDDKELALHAVGYHRQAVEGLSERLSDDIDIILAASSHGEHYGGLLGPNTREEWQGMRTETGEQMSISDFLTYKRFEDMDNKITSEKKPVKDPMALRDEQAALSNGATKTKSNKLKI